MTQGVFWTKWCNLIFTFGEWVGKEDCSELLFKLLHSAVIWNIGCWDITRPNARLYRILMDETILPQSPTLRGLVYSCNTYFWVLMFWFEMGPCYVAWLVWYWVCRQSWVQSFSSSASAPQVQRLQACITMTCFILFFGFCSFLVLFCLTLKPKQAVNMQQSLQAPECWGYMSEILAPYYRFRYRK